MAAPLVALAVRERTGRRERDRSRPAGTRPERRPRRRAGRRRGHARHRLRVPVRDVRAERRRAVRLLRQRGVHEHGRPTLERDTAGGENREHEAGRRASRGTSSDRARTRRSSPWRTGFPTSRPRRSRTCTTWRRKVERAMELRGSALPPRPRAMPARLGLGVEGHDQARPPRARRQGSSPSSRPSTARSSPSRRSDAPSRWRSISAPRSVSRTSSGIAAHRRRRARPGESPTTTSAASDCSRSRDGQAVRNHPRRRLEPRQPDR